jgi:isopropylmalate/homocitrate/citramalate synthase
MLDAVLKNTDIKSEQLEWHGHNDFHKVSVNAVTAWMYGCCAANGTLFGFGERTGNPPIEGLLIEWMGLTGIHDGIDPTAITDASDYFEEKIGHPLPSNFPFVGADFNTTRAGIHADGLSKNEEIYNIFDTGKWLNRPCKVAVTNNSGLAGIAYWIYTNMGDKAADIRKDHPGLVEVKNWIDQQYAAGRITSISDKEMRMEIKKVLPELFK